MNRTILFCLVALGVISIGTARRTGAPGRACSTMRPFHPPFNPQKSEAPYTIYLEKKNLSPGDSSIIVLKSNGGDEFRGFMIQCRIQEEIVGQFIPNPKKYKTKDCLGGTMNSVTQIDPTQKKEVTVTWVAPKDITGDVTCYATVVQEYYTFWVQQPSAKATVA